MVINIKKKFINIIAECQKEYDKNLKNNKIMFIIEENNKINKEEVFFGKRNFYHLTGIRAFNNTGSELSPSNFYYLLSRGRIDRLNIERKDNMADLKLQILPQLMRIDRTANMIGDYYNSNIFLQTEKVAGNINSCMGFVKDKKMNIYIPNTALNLDLRSITSTRNKIVAILKKNINDKLYKNITYLKVQYEIKDILKNPEVNKNINLKEIYSKDKLINKKIFNFYQNISK